MVNKFTALVSAALLSLAATAAHATPIVIGATDTFTSTTSPTDGECCFTVKLTQLSTTEIGVDVSLSKLNSGEPTPLWASTGSHVGFGFNLDETASLTNINFPWSSSNVTMATAKTSGVYADQIDNGWETGTSGYGGPPKTPYGGDLTFDLSVSSGTLTFADFASSDDFYFEADILGNNSTGEGYINCAGTIQNPSPTPEPSSLMLLGTGMLGAGLFVRRRRAAASINA